MNMWNKFQRISFIVILLDQLRNIFLRQFFSYIMYSAICLMGYFKHLIFTYICIAIALKVIMLYFKSVF